MVKEAPVGVERSPGLQCDGVHPAALVSQLHTLAFAERTPAAGGTHGYYPGGAGGVCGVAPRDVVGGSFAAHGIFLAFVNLGGHASVRPGTSCGPEQRYFTTGR
ncbi:hypothetical protein D9M72_489980 [compost metagenome]